MTVREYLQRFNQCTDVTFIKARARKDSHTPGYHAEYQTTPIRSINVWKESEIMDYYILNDKQCPIDWLSGAPWKNQFDSGNLMSLLVISKGDLELLYHPEQAARLTAFIDGKINGQEGNIILTDLISSQLNIALDQYYTELEAKDNVYTYTGDISPEQAMEWEAIVSQIANLFEKLAEHNKRPR